jgi:hypothetical protein
VESGKHGELVEDAVDLITIKSPWNLMSEVEIIFLTDSGRSYFVPRSCKTVR